MRAEMQMVLLLFQGNSVAENPWGRDMVLMKPSRLRAEGQVFESSKPPTFSDFALIRCNSKPTKRQAFPDLCQQTVNEYLDDYVRSMGVQQAFNLHNYKNLTQSQAEDPRRIYKLHKLLGALLQCSSSGQVKYKFLKEAMLNAQQTFGEEALSAHFESTDQRTRAGSVADCLTVLLNHWRRVASTTAAFSRFCKKLDSAQSQIMENLREQPGGEAASSSTAENKRALKEVPTLDMSEVSVDNHGLVKMIPLKKGRKDNPDGPSACSPVSMDSSGLAKMADLGESCCSKPTSLQEGHWKTVVEKKPATAETKKGKAADASLKPPEDIKIDDSSLSIGGGKNQSYIQHMPEGPGTSKRLVVSISNSQASRTTKSHRQLVQLLLPFCTGKTKKAILLQRDILLKKYQKK